MQTKPQYIPLVFATMVFLAGYMPVEAVTSGWVLQGVEYVGSDTSCGAGKAKIEVALMEHDSEILINPTGVIMYVYIIDDNNNVSDSATNIGQNISDGLCIDPVNEGVNIVVMGGQYQSARTAGLFWPDTSHANILAGIRYRAHVHLQSPLNIFL